MWKWSLGMVLVVVCAVGPTAADNLLTNPDFDSDPTNPVNGWSTLGTGSLTHNMSMGDPAPPSARADNSDFEWLSLEQCVVVSAADVCEFSVRSFTHNSTAGSASSVSVSFFSSSDCTTGLLENVPTHTAWFPDWWLRAAYAVEIPISAQSARMELLAETSDAGALMNISWDNTILNCGIYIDGFESGDVSLWSAAVGVALDFGDAPSPYPTLAADNGARHVVGNLFLGLLVDAEPDGQPSAWAAGDDEAGDYDEDGLFFYTIIRGATGLVYVTASGAGFLNGWIDWDQDGGWTDANEQVFIDQALLAGENDFDLIVPPSATAGFTYGRFRISSLGGESYDGSSAIGEVEDYQLLVNELGEIILQPSTIAENTDTSAGDVDVGTLTAQSGDPNSMTYSLVIGAGDTDNDTFLVLGDVLFIKQGTTVDYESQTTYSVRVRADDGVSPAVEEGITVFVVNLPD